jgi:predicted metalloendopeptidase
MWTSRVYKRKVIIIYNSDTSTGRQSDKYGNLAQWWSKSTIDTYLEKAQCFIEQYGMYRVPELDDLLHTEVMVSEILFMRK